MIALTIVLALCSLVVSEEIAIECQNGGKLSVSHCICPSNFIGQMCQIPAQPLSALPLEKNIGQNYSYFFFEPEQVNFYRLNFSICMKKNPSKTPTLFFVTTERTDNSLKQVPAFFETFKLLLPTDGCTFFSSHYISIKRREDDSFRRIIVGMKTMQSQQKNLYFNIFKADNLNDTVEAQMNSLRVQDAKDQQITLKMSYQLYLETSYHSSFIILVTSFVLMAVLALILNYIRKKYLENQEEQLSNEGVSVTDLFRETQRNNPQYYYEHKNDLTVLEVFMPPTQYGLQSKFFVSDQLKFRIEFPEEYPQSESCSVCLVDFEADDQVRTTPCRHRYHKDCIDNWCETSLSCPICRGGLDFNRELRTIYMRHLRGDLCL